MSTRSRGSLSRLVTATALALVASSVALLGATAPAHAGASCEYGSYTDVKWRLVSARKAAVLTHKSTLTLAPGESAGDSVTIIQRRVIRAAAKIGGEVSGEYGNKVIGKGGFKLSLDLATSGKKTDARNITYKRKLVNKTKKNQTYVVFAGAMKGLGRWKRSYCKQVTGTVGEVKWEYGKWASFEYAGTGRVACGQGSGSTTDPIAEAALKTCQ